MIIPDKNSGAPLLGQLGISDNTSTKNKTTNVQYVSSFDFGSDSGADSIEYLPRAETNIAIATYSPETDPFVTLAKKRNSEAMGLKTKSSFGPLTFRENSSATILIFDAQKLNI